MPHHGLGGHGDRIAEHTLWQVHPHEHARLVVGVVVVEFRHERHAAALGLHGRAHVVDRGRRVVDQRPGHGHAHGLAVGHVHRRPLPLVHHRAHPERRGVGHDEHPLARSHALAPGHEDVLDEPVDRRPQHEGAQRIVVGLVPRRVVDSGVADERPEVFPGDFEHPFGLLALGDRLVALLPREEPRLLALRVETLPGDLEVALPFLDDAARQHAATLERRRAGPHLLRLHEFRVAAEDELTVIAEYLLPKASVDVVEGWMGLQCDEHGLDVPVDRRGPVGGLGRDLEIGHALAHVVAGHADVAAGEFGERITGRHPLPHPHVHLGDDPVHRRPVVDLTTGVVVHPPRHGDVVAQRHASHPDDVHIGRDGLRRQRDDTVRRDCRRRLVRRMPRVASRAAKVVGGEPPPREATGREKRRTDQAASQAGRDRRGHRCMGGGGDGHGRGFRKVRGLQGYCRHELARAVVFRERRASARPRDVPWTFSPPVRDRRFTAPADHAPWRLKERQARG